MTNPVTIGAGVTVSIDGNGHQVTLNGTAQTRHFVVSGGSLTLSHMILRNGTAAAPAAQPARPAAQVRTKTPARERTARTAATAAPGSRAATPRAAPFSSPPER